LPEWGEPARPRRRPKRTQRRPKTIPEREARAIPEREARAIPEREAREAARTFREFPCDPNQPTPRRVRCRGAMRHHPRCCSPKKEKPR
jgi:hypothetical protein